MTDPVPPPIILEASPPPPPPMLTESFAKRRNRGWRQTLRLAIVVATTIWVIAIIASTVLGFAAQVLDQNLQWNDAYVWKLGSFLPVKREEFIASSMSIAVVGGLCCPTVPFVIAMVVLGALYFATGDK